MTTVDLKQKNNPLVIPTIVILILLAIIGIIISFILFFDGLSLTGMNNRVPMGIWIAAEIFLTGISAGALFVSSLSYVFGIEKYKPLARISVWIAQVMIVVAPLFLILEVAGGSGDVVRFLNDIFNLILLKRNLTSALAWGVIFLILYPLSTFFYGWAMTRSDCAQKAELSSGFKKKIYSFLALGRLPKDLEGVEKDERMAKWLGTISLALAIGAHGYTGFLFGLVVVRPLWNSPLMPFIFLTSAIVSGIAFVIIAIQIINFFFEENAGLEIVPGLSKILLYAIIVDIILASTEIITAMYSKIPENLEVVNLLFYGPFNWLFIIFQVIIGAVIPTVILISENRRNSQKMVGLSCLFVLIGIFALRVNIIITGQIPQLFGFMGELQFGSVNDYFPSIFEILSTIGLISISILVIMFGYYFLPLISSKIAKDNYYHYWKELGDLKE